MWSPRPCTHCGERLLVRLLSPRAITAPASLSLESHHQKPSHITSCSEDLWEVCLGQDWALSRQMVSSRNLSEGLTFQVWQGKASSALWQKSETRLWIQSYPSLSGSMVTLLHIQFSCQEGRDLRAQQPLSESHNVVPGSEVMVQCGKFCPPKIHLCTHPAYVSSCGASGS